MRLTDIVHLASLEADAAKGIQTKTLSTSTCPATNAPSNARRGARSTPKGCSQSQSLLEGLGPAPAEKLPSDTARQTATHPPGQFVD